MKYIGYKITIVMSLLLFSININAQQICEIDSFATYIDILPDSIPCGIALTGDIEELYNIEANFGCDNPPQTLQGSAVATYCVDSLYVETIAGRDSIPIDYELYRKMLYHGLHITPELVECLNMNCLIDVNHFFTPEMLSVLNDSIAANAHVLDDSLSTEELEELGIYTTAVEFFSDPNNTIEDLNGLIDSVKARLNINIDSLMEVAFGVGLTGQQPGDCGDLEGGINQILQRGITGNNKSAKNADLDVLSKLSKNLSLSEVGTPTPSIPDFSADNGVDLFTGAAQSSISLLSMNSINLGESISLSYRSNGVKVDATGSEVGQSWNLNDGGEIIRIVNGLPDDINNTIYGQSVGNVPTVKYTTLISGGINIGPDVGGVVEQVIQFNPFNAVNAKSDIVKAYWSPYRPNQLEIRIKVATFTVWFLNIDIYVTTTVRLELGYKPGSIKLKEKQLGYSHLNNSALMGQFDLNPLSDIDIENFYTKPESIQKKYLSEFSKVEGFEDLKFIVPEIGKYVDIFSNLEAFLGEKVVKSHTIDTQADQYVISSNGISANFYITPEKKVIIEGNTGLIITPFYKNFHNAGERLVGFKVVDKSGIEYIFGNKPSEIETDYINYKDNKYVEIKGNTTYSLPNYYDYPDFASLNRKDYLAAELAWNYLPYPLPIMGFPVDYGFANDYTHNYNISNKKKDGEILTYISSWKLNAKHNPLSNDTISYDYEKLPISEYNSSKGFSLKIPNFKEGHNRLIANPSLSDLNDLHLFPTNWQGGKAVFTYSVVESLERKSILKTVKGRTGESLELFYDQERRDLPGGKLLTEVHKYIDSSFVKGYKLSYGDTTLVADLSTTCDIADETVSSPIPEIVTNNGFLIDLGTKYKRPKFQHSIPLPMFISIFGISINFPLRIPLPPLSKDNSSGIKSMDEYGAIFTVKQLANIMIDDSVEEDKIIAENSRHFLKDIYEIDRSLNNHPYVSLTYIDEKQLPKRFSMMKDPWGYYNDNSESMSILPPVRYRDFNNNIVSAEVGRYHVVFSDANNPTAKMWKGINESPTLSYAQTGMLNTVEYMTGGNVSFEYELNEAPDNSITEFRDGGGVRVVQLTIDAVENEKSIIYEYNNPYSIGMPIFIDNDYLDKTNFESESYVHLSSNSLFPEKLISGSYTGFQKVFEIFPDNGMIEHNYRGENLCNVRQFEPLHLPLAPDCDGKSIRYVLKDKKYFNFGIKSNVSPVHKLYTQNELYTSNEIIPSDLRERSTYFFNEANDEEKSIKVHVTNYNREGDVDESSNTPNTIIGIQPNVYTRYNPPSFNYGLQAGLLYNYLPFKTSIVKTIFMYLWTSVVNNEDFVQSQYVNRVYSYTLQEIPATTVVLESVKTTETFENSSNYENTTYSYENKNRGEQVYKNVVSQLTTTSDNISKKTEYYFPESAQHQDPTVMNEFIAIKYMQPIETYTTIGNDVTGEWFKWAYSPSNNLYYPYAKFTERHNTIRLNYVVSSINEYGKPTLIKVAKWGSGANILNYDFRPDITITYDGSKLLPTKMSFVGLSQEKRYTQLRELKYTKDVNNIVTSYSYDNRGRVNLIKSLNGAVSEVIEYTLGAGNNTITTTTHYQDQTPSISLKKNYDGFGKPLEVKRVNDGAILESKVYDSFFRLVETTTLGGGTTIHEYNKSPVERLISQTDEENNITRFKYGADMLSLGAFQSTEIEDPNGAIVISSVNSLGNIAGKRSGEGNLTKYVYDNSNRLSEIITPEGRKYEYTYNEMDKIRTKKIPSQSSKTTYWYDQSGRELCISMPNGSIILIEHNQRDQVVGNFLVDENAAIVWAGSEIVDDDDIGNSFHEARRLLKNEYSSANTYLTKQKIKLLPFDDNLGFITMNFKKDDIGRDTAIYKTYPDNLLKYIVRNTYNDAGNVLNEKHLLTGATGISEKVEFKYEHDYLQRPSREFFNYADINIPIKGYTYNQKDQLSTELVGYSSQGGYLQSQTFGYDKIGRLASINNIDETMCNPLQSKCDFEFSREFYLDYNYCIKGVVIDGELVSFNKRTFVMSSSQGDDSPIKLENLLREALDRIGLSVEDVQVYKETGTIQYGEFMIFTTIIKVKIVSLSAIDVSFQLCDESTRPLQKSNCCQDPLADPYDIAEGLYSFQPSLFAETLEYEGLDIKKILLNNGCEEGKMEFNYSYDLDHRLSRMTSIIPGLGEVSNPYASTYTYTADGDIEKLKRRGFIEEVNGNKNYGMIDDLTFDVKVNGHINTVTDNASGPGQAKGFFPTSASFIYDDKSGNILDDGSRTYTYNTIDLPSRIENSESGKNEDIIYSYQGEKYRVEGDSTLHYIGIFELKDLEVKKVHYTDGFAYKGDSLRLRYRLKDHLGNPVVIFEDVNKDGRINLDTTGLDAPEVIERMVYYPFGLSFDGLYDASGKHELGSRYKFGGKEVVSGVYDFGARYYYPAIGRFMGVDPLAEKFPNWSPYNYTMNNPINLIDPDGREPIKPYVGTVGDFVSLLNNSSRKVGAFKGAQASSYLSSLSNTKFDWKKGRPMPTQTGYFNMKKGRYIYTTKGGWVDMTHFLFYAGAAYNYKQDGSKNPIGKAVQDGYIQEASDVFFAPHSAYSYEDLPSDKFGADFAVNFFDPNSDLTFAEQLESYLVNELGATDPSNAPNYDNLPTSDNQKKPTRQNVTTTPVYVDGDDGTVGQPRKKPENDNPGRRKPGEY